MMRKSCEEFTESLASRAAVPGGGSAAALVGSIGIALGNMAGSLTVGKKAYAQVEAEVQELNERAASLRIRLLSMADADAAAFEPLSRAYGLPKGTEEERAEKARVMEEALKTAAAAPLEIMKLCVEALEVIERYAQIGSRLAVSDAGCGAVCCRAALEAAALNVAANTRLMQDRTYAAALHEQMQALRERGAAFAAEAERQVWESVQTHG